jgi:hypothetical protein
MNHRRVYPGIWSVFLIVFRDVSAIAPLMHGARVNPPVFRCKESVSDPSIDHLVALIAGKLDTDAEKVSMLASLSEAVSSDSDGSIKEYDTITTSVEN